MGGAAAPPYREAPGAGTIPSEEEAARPVANPDGVICLPLGPILAALPADLAGLVASPAGGNFFLPVKTATAQLGSGAVKIPFGELRQGSPPGTFYDNATQDVTPVKLPLGQILSRLDLSLLARRPGQKWVAVPESVTSVFGQGRKLQAPVCAPVRAAEPSDCGLRIADCGLPLPKAPTSETRAANWGLPIADPPSLRSGAASRAVPLPKVPAPEPGTSRFARLPTTAPLPSPGPNVPAGAEQNRSPQRQGILGGAAAPLYGEELRPAPDREFVEVRLSALSEGWPAEVVKIIAECKLQEATVSLPMGRLEAGLKKGRVVFTWGDLCQWIQPPPLEQASAQDGTALELPLKVVAPLFMARRRAWAVPKQMTGAAEIPEQIPDIFGRTDGTAGRAAPVPAMASGTTALVTALMLAAAM